MTTEINPRLSIFDPLAIEYKITLFKIVKEIKGKLADIIREQENIKNDPKM